MRKTCDGCGAEFEAQRPHARFCSKRCNNDWHNARRERGRAWSGHRPKGTRRTPRPTPKVMARGTQRWLEDPSVSCCRFDGCFNDGDTCLAHSKTDQRTYAEKMRALTEQAEGDSAGE